MAFSRTPIRKILIPAMAFLILCGIVFAELPELLCLTDNTTNDFTVRKAPAAIVRVFVETTIYAGLLAINAASPLGLLFSSPGSLDNVASSPSKLFLLHSDLRM